jgi:hypothetical protein
LNPHLMTQDSMFYPIVRGFSITTKLHQCIKKGIGYYRYSPQ